MIRSHFIKRLVEGYNKGDCFESYAAVIFDTLHDSEREQLKQLASGPVWDGDVISKSDRDFLIMSDLAVQCCCNGEQGYTASAPIGYTILKDRQ